MFIDKPMVITEPAVESAQLLGPGGIPVLRATRLNL